MTWAMATGAALVMALPAGCGLEDDGGLDGGVLGGDGGPALDGASNGGSCGFSEAEPNDQRQQATPYAAGQILRGCLGSREDVDLYALTAPATPAGGGYFQAALTEVGAGQLEVAVFAVSDESRLLSGVRTFDEGGSLFFYWAAAPGQQYRVSVSRFGAGAAAFAYTFKATYTGVEDLFEPNDVRDQARPLPLGMTARAFFFAGFAGRDIAPTAYDDWFLVPLVAGRVNIALTEVPTDVGPQVRLFGPDGGERASRLNSEPGGSVTLDAVIPPATAGMHRLQVTIFSVRPAAAAESTSAGTLPDSFTRSYSLRVSQ